MNIFMLMGDSLHTSAIIFLIYQIIHKKCCKGVSGKTQILMLMVYITRYIDLFLAYISFYNSFFKIGYTVSSILIICLIFGVYKNTNEGHDHFKAEILVFICMLAGVLFNDDFTWVEILWTFSIYLEAGAIIPQLYMIFKTCEITYIAKGYLLLMGPYRGFYILNWIYRYYSENHLQDTHAIVSGIIQELIYIVFLILYFTHGRFTKTTNTDSNAIVTENKEKTNLENNINIFSLNLDPESLTLSGKNYKYLPLSDNK